MKKQSLLLITGGILAFASCNNDTAGTNDNSQATIDSMVNERVEMIRAELEATNDSIINERAMYLADSMMAVASGKPAPARPAAKPAQKPAEKPADKPKGGVNDRPGATNKGTGDGGVSDRPGATNKSTGNGGVSDRPGATNK